MRTFSIVRAGMYAIAGILSLASPASAQVFDHVDVAADGVSEASLERIGNELHQAQARIARFFSERGGAVQVHVFAHRDEFSRALREAWGIPDTQCWMVGAADDSHLYLLSPDSWMDEACEHDPSDEEHVRLLVTHELVHVYHGQINPSADVGLLEDIGWFTEGLAVYVSGQLEERHAGRAAEAIATDQAPETLATAWSGPYRYGVTGSMVAFIDAHWGRDVLRAALSATSQPELLGLLGTTEPEFFAAWRNWVERSTSG
ncbi:MAG: hypothetical protein PVF05_10120 [Gemmatimonadales bacterium]|jgi:hypothetical protein